LTCAEPALQQETLSTEIKHSAAHKPERTVKGTAPSPLNPSSLPCFGAELTSSSLTKYSLMGGPPAAAAAAAAGQRKQRIRNICTPQRRPPARLQSNADSGPASCCASTARVHTH
jgi:hypothetical protein